MADESSGTKLSGRLMDANGRQGLIDMVIEKDQRKASWTMRLFERDTQAQELHGTFELAIEGDHMKAATSAEKQKNESGVPLELSITAAAAGNYAEQAHVGQYQVRDPGAGAPISRGVLILWRFR